MRSLTRVTGEVIRQVSQTTYIILYDYYIIDYFNIIILIFKYYSVLNLFISKLTVYITNSSIASKS